MAALLPPPSRAPPLAPRPARGAVGKRAPSPGRPAWPQIGENITDEELGEMIAEADNKGRGEVDEDDFVKIVTSYAQHYDGER